MGERNCERERKKNIEVKIEAIFQVG